MEAKERHEAVCRRCGYRWFPSVEHPRRCTSCKSPYWDRPRQSELYKAEQHIEREEARQGGLLGDLNAIRKGGMFGMRERQEERNPRRKQKKQEAYA